jgi:hypothetical protein
VNKRRRAPRRPRPRQQEKFLKKVKELLLLQGVVCNGHPPGATHVKFRAWTEFGELEIHKPDDEDHVTFTVFARFDDHRHASQRISSPAGKYNFHHEGLLDDAVEDFKSWLNTILWCGRPPAWYRVKKARDAVVEEILYVTKQNVPHPPKTPAYRAIRKAVARIMRLRRGYGMWRFREMLVPKQEEPDGTT